MAVTSYTVEQKALLRELLNAGAILIGEAVRERFGLNSPFYLDLRENLYARPELLWGIGREFACKLRELTRGQPVPQCVVGIPDTATPLALATALYAWQQQIHPPITYAMLRKEGKTYPGHPTSHWIGQRAAECEYNLIDDVVASGQTKRAAAARMQCEGISLRRIIVFFDRDQGDGLRREGYDLHAIFRVPEVLDFYRDEGLIRPEEHRTILQHLQSRRFEASAVAK